MSTAMSKCFRFIEHGSDCDRVLGIKDNALVLRTQHCIEHHGPECHDIKNSKATRLTENAWLVQQPVPKLCCSVTTDAGLLNMASVLKTPFGDVYYVNCLEADIAEKRHGVHLPKIFFKTRSGQTRLIGINMAHLQAQAFNDDGYDEPHFKSVDDVFDWFYQTSQYGRLVYCTVSPIAEKLRAGESDLKKHCEIIRKVGLLAGEKMAHHDFTKTQTINLALGLLFHNEDNTVPIDDRQRAVLKDVVTRGHLMQETHHPETQHLDVVEMYIDRVSRNAQFTTGISADMWKLDEKFIPKEEKDAVGKLTLRYKDLTISDQSAEPADVVEDVDFIII